MHRIVYWSVLARFIEIPWDHGFGVTFDFSVVHNVAQIKEISFLLASSKTMFVIISSPELEVLMMSYCDQSMSVVRRASFVVNNLF